MPARRRELRSQRVALVLQSPRHRRARLRQSLRGGLGIAVAGRVRHPALAEPSLGLGKRLDLAHRRAARREQRAQPVRALRQEPQIEQRGQRRRQVVAQAKHAEAAAVVELEVRMLLRQPAPEPPDAEVARASAAWNRATPRRGETASRRARKS
ncbi:hypothetical protein [Caldovatus aquaticus]|uniref:Uncharacterized protein n=1 Tax=Caldovatus aquaticus TaxID=2865671 RepID=A0ABS7F2G4_9PROT|nr:hypothetical protein [Caldovatus aquaticus]MBW8268990.1 hypothetical protein [Caldovatus aquaticus]